MSGKKDVIIEKIRKCSLISLEMNKVLCTNAALSHDDDQCSPNNNNLPIHLDDHDDETDESLSDVRMAIRSGDHCMLKTALLLLPRDLQHMKLTLRYAIRIKDSPMLELVYDHWAGVGYCNSTVPAQYLAQLQHLGTALEQAKNTSNFHFERDQQLIVDVYCLREFNSFQIDLYSNLYNVPPAIDENDRLREKKSLLLVAIGLYVENSNKNIRATVHLPSDKHGLELLLKDDTTKYMKYMMYAMYEMFYRKLDLNIATLILNNIHSLKLRLELDSDAYQKIECALYYFLYRMDEDWRLYVPQNRIRRKTLLAVSDDDTENIYVDYDHYRLISGPVIYLEWIKFKEAVRKFQEVVKSTIPRQDVQTLLTHEVQNLMLEPRMRDDYSLKKIIKYVEECRRAATREHGVLIVQRTVQVVGEYLKDSKASLHLTPTTVAVINTHIPYPITSYLKHLRDKFSKIRESCLLHKIELENQNPGIFDEVKQDLEQFQKSLTQVHKMYKHVVEKSLLQNGLKLIQCRFKELPGDAEYYVVYIKIMRVVTNTFEELMELQKPFIEKCWSRHNLSEQLLREIHLLIDNEERLKKELRVREIKCIKEAINHLSTYMKYINETVNEIEKYIQTWDSIKTDMNSLPNNIFVDEVPNHQCKSNIKTHINKYKRSHTKVTAEIFRKLDSMIFDFTVQWNTVINLLKFLVEEIDIFIRNDNQIRMSEFSNQLSRIFNGCHNKQGIENVRQLLEYIKKEAEKYCKGNMLPNPEEIEPYEYKGIRELYKLMSMYPFITHEEKEYLKQNVGRCTCGSSSCLHVALVEKVMRGDKITHEEETELSKHVLKDVKCHRIIQNLVKGKNREALSLQCLANRAQILKDIKDKLGNGLEDEYYRDGGLRLILEAVLADVILVDSERQLNLPTGTGNLLAEMPLRNVFAHGHPLLEVIGARLDPTDSPATQLALAARVAEDAPALVALCELHSQGVQRDQAEQVYDGPYSPRLQIYFKLLPK